MTTLHVHLAEEFRRRIARGTWSAGEAIPSEAALCEEFGTSRGPVRQAIAALRDEGVIAGGRGRPPRVVGPGVPSQPFSTFFSFTEWAPTVGAVPGQRTIEVARRGADPTTAALLEIAADEPVVEVLRVRLLDDTPAMLERTTFVLDAGRHLFDFDPDSGSIFAHLTSVGVDLHQARHTIDAVAANDEDADLLDVTPGTPLLRERRLTRDRNGRALESSDDRYLPTVTNFMIDNRADHRTRLSRVAASS